MLLCHVIDLNWLPLTLHVHENTFSWPRNKQGAASLVLFPGSCAGEPGNEAGGSLVSPGGAYVMKSK